MKLQRNRTIAFTIIFAMAIILFIDPFNFFNQKRPPRLDFDQQQLDLVRAVVLEEAKPAIESVIDALKTNKVTMIGETGLIRDEVNFFIKVISQIPNDAPSSIGLDTLLVSDNEELSMLIDNPVWDESVARSLFFNNSPVWGYQEYINIAKAVWEKRQSGADLRLLGLSYSADFSLIKTNEDFRNPTIIRTVWPLGLPDSFMASEIQSHLDQEPERRVLVFCQKPYLFAYLFNLGFEAEMSRLGFTELRHCAQILKERYGDASVHLVHFNSPWPFKSSDFGLSYFADGLFEKVVESLELGDTNPWPLAIDLGSKRLDSITLSLHDFDPGKKTKLSQLGDSVVILGSVRKFTTVAAIDNFITTSNISELAKRIPGLSNPNEATPADLNNSIRSASADFQQVLSEFR